MPFNLDIRCNPFRRQNSRWPEVILTFVLILLVMGSAVFGVGMVHYSSNKRPKPPEDLTKDPSFYILLSQSLVNVLTSSCTLASVLKDGPRVGLKNQPVIVIATAMAIILAVTVPATYIGGGKATKQTQVRAMVVNFCSGVCTISAAVFLANLGPRNSSQNRAR